MNKRSMVPEKGAASVAAAVTQPETKIDRRLATRDKEVIRAWAARHGAEPATGEATPSGPATTHVNDGGAGIRFNFPAAAPFRPISWEEWFDNFDRHHLVFIYDEDVAHRAYELWQHRGGGVGRDQEDWFEAERQLGRARRGSMEHYRLVSEHALDEI